MDKTCRVLKEIWSENYYKLLQINKEDDRIIKQAKESGTAAPLLFLSTGDTEFKNNMELIETIAVKLGYGEYEEKFKWK